jgi:Polyketide cyclase / dehydrase and lipid transport
MSRADGVTQDVDPLIEESVEVAADLARVWSLVSDLPRLAEWSPQVARSFVRGGRPVRLGTRLVNVNRRGPLVWPTRSKVVRFEPHREIAFRVKDNFTVWSFTLEPTATGTRLVQRREAPDGISSISARLTRGVLGGVPAFQDELRAGMRATLVGIKDAAEA